MVAGRVLAFRLRRDPAPDQFAAAQGIFALSFEDRISRAAELKLDDPEILLAVSGALREGIEGSPSPTLTEADFFYRYLEKPRRPIGLFDEREYFLGEIALLAGSAARILGRHEEARRWLDRADSNFRLTVNAVAETARVSYQRLTLSIQERQFAVVLELVPSLAECFTRQEMHQDALKCFFLEAIAYKETGEWSEALSRFEALAEKCEVAGNDKMRASAYVNLIQLHSENGNEAEALELSKGTLSLLRQLGNRVDEAKVHWGISMLLRQKGRYEEALESFRSCDEKYLALEMFPDSAATRLVMADLLLERGRDAEATAAILSALPIIEKYEMIPEGTAALVLLRESARVNQVNRGALREVHGYFDQLSER
ncbi:MAG: tetratricopeptide repeat protein [Acidobacteria bacterium]|nr:tetratricopeptide repeat protein [Acidobacteriota bacterium]MCA1609476.1 tetratricopeptide repeat protein [Acidobacteriota bacterium]